MRKVASSVAALLAAAAAHAKIVTEVLPYKHGALECRGFLAYDEALTGPRPGVLVVHEWWGLNDFAREKARALAELGYVALAVDMYGQGQVVTTVEEAGRLAGQFRGDATLWRERAKAGLDALAAHPRVDPRKIAAIGFCFGGSTVLQMAAAGYDLAAVVSFHGGLAPFAEADAARIKARILVLHGAADTLVPDELVQAFQDSLRKSRADWQIVVYGGAKHSFTNPEADKLNMPGVGYDATTARRAWAQMRALFDETFAPGERGP